MAWRPYAPAGALVIGFDRRRDPPSDYMALLMEQEVETVVCAQSTRRI